MTTKERRGTEKKAIDCGFHRQPPELNSIGRPALSLNTPVLSIKQPWASFICPSALLINFCNSLDSPFILPAPLPKNVENRTWNTNYRGFLFVHASKSIDPFFCSETNYLVQHNFFLFPKSSIIGYVYLSYVIKPFKNEHSPWWSNDKFGFFFSSFKTFQKPILNVKGSLGLWRLPLNLNILSSKAIKL